MITTMRQAHEVLPSANGMGGTIVEGSMMREAWDLDSEADYTEWLDGRFSILRDRVLATTTKAELGEIARKSQTLVKSLWILDKARMTELAAEMKAHADTLN